MLFKPLFGRFLIAEKCTLDFQRPVREALMTQSRRYMDCRASGLQVDSLTRLSRDLLNGMTHFWDRETHTGDAYQFVDSRPIVNDKGPSAL